MNVHTISTDPSFCLTCFGYGFILFSLCFLGFDSHVQFISLHKIPKFQVIPWCGNYVKLHYLMQCIFVELLFEEFLSFCVPLAAFIEMALCALVERPFSEKRTVSMKYHTLDYFKK